MTDRTATRLEKAGVTLAQARDANQRCTASLQKAARLEQPELGAVLDKVHLAKAWANGMYEFAHTDYTELLANDRLTGPEAATAHRGLGLIALDLGKPDELQSAGQALKELGSDGVAALRGLLAEPALPVHVRLNWMQHLAAINGPTLALA